MRALWGKLKANIHKRRNRKSTGTPATCDTTVDTSPASIPSPPSLSTPPADSSVSPSSAFLASAPSHGPDPALSSASLLQTKSVATVSPQASEVISRGVLERGSSTAQQGALTDAPGAEKLAIPEAATGIAPEGTPRARPGNVLRDTTRGPAPGPSPAPGWGELWADAYAQYSEEEPSLLQLYEKVVAFEMTRLGGSGEVAGPSAAHDAGSLSDPQIRQSMMFSLAQGRLRAMESRASSLGTAITVASLIKGLATHVKEAVEAAPPVSLALGGVCLLLDGCSAGIEGYQDCLGGLTWVVSRIGWYLQLPELTRGSLATDGPKEATRTTIRDDLVRLFASLIQYQVRSVCRYYKTRKVLTFLEDMLIEAEWTKLRESIQEAESRLLLDVDTYDSHQAAVLRDAQSKHLESCKNLLEELNAHLRSLEERDVRREKRELQRVKEMGREKTNALIATFSLPGNNYDEFKNKLNPKPADDTGNWLRNHEQYAEWLRQESGILVLAANPGCGKSVLARSVVDNAMDKKDGGFDVVCHFFFKDARRHISLAAALCAVLHQLFTQRPEAITEVQDTIERRGSAALREDTTALWALFETAVMYLGNNNKTKILCVFDALDEAKPDACKDLVDSLRAYFESGPGGGLKVFATCRPYMHILVGFPAMQTGIFNVTTKDHELDVISHEIDLVIDRELDQWVSRRRIHTAEETVQRMKRALKRHGRQTTYLWVRVVFESLNGRRALVTCNDSDLLRSIETLPPTVSDSYEALLRQVPDEDQRAIRYALSVVFAVDPEHATISLVMDVVAELSRLDGDPWEGSQSPELFETWLRNTCGFLVHVYKGSIEFIHQTVKESLQPGTELTATQPEQPIPGKNDDTSVWKHSFTSRDCNRVVAEACIASLSPAVPKVGESTHSPGISLASYAGPNKFGIPRWLTHFERCQHWTAIKDGVPQSLTDVRSALVQKYLDHVRQAPPSQRTYATLLRHGHLRPAEYAARNPLLCSELLPHPSDYPLYVFHEMVLGGHVGVVECVLHFKSTAFINEYCATWADRPPSSRPSIFRCTTAPMVRLLLSRGADPTATDEDRRTVLHKFVSESKVDILSELLSAAEKPGIAATHKGGAVAPHDAGLHQRQQAAGTRIQLDINAKDVYGNAPLHYCNNATAMALLLAAGADVNLVNNQRQTALHQCQSGPATKVLLGAGANVHATDNKSQTPLFFPPAERFGGGRIRILLQHAASATVTNEQGDSPFHVWLRSQGNSRFNLIRDMQRVLFRNHFVEMFRVVFDEPRSYGCPGQSCLHEPGADSCPEFTKLLNLQNHLGETALLCACKSHKSLEALWLLEKGADPKLADRSGSSPANYEALLAERYNGRPFFPEFREIDLKLLLALAHAEGEASALERLFRTLRRRISEHLSFCEREDAGLRPAQTRPAGGKKAREILGGPMLVAMDLDCLAVMLDHGLSLTDSGSAPDRRMAQLEEVVRERRARAGGGSYSDYHRVLVWTENGWVMKDDPLL